MKFKLLLAAVLVTTFSLAGCATQPSTTTKDAKTGSNATKDGEPKAKKTTEAPVKNPKFGETVTYPNGLQITVKKPVKFKPSEYAFLEESKAYMSFNVVVLNNTGKNFDTSMMYYTLQSGDEEASEVFDSDKGYEGTPSTKLLDGRQAKFKIGFGVNTPEDLVLEMQPGDFESESTIYTN